MTKTIEYRQCTLRKTRSATSSTVIVSYIPARFAHLRDVIKLKQTDGSWSDGWTVEKVGAKISEADLPNTHQGIKGHRKATGDALPRRR